MSKDLESRVRAIEERNRRVELDKKWETSWTRRLAIAGLSYIVIAIYLVAIGNDKPFMNAIVPTAGFVISTLVLKSIREIWQSKNH